jgi:surface carbohydrate biosynthesis protein
MNNKQILKKMIFYLPKYLMYWLIRNNYSFPIALFYKVFIIKRKRGGINSFTANSDKITILAINANMFRGDLECLAQVDKFRVLTLDYTWETILWTAFTNKHIEAHEYLNAEVGCDIYALKEKINHFFSGFISSLLRLIKIDCIVTVNYRYYADLLWVMHLTNKGIPHICFYREGLMNTDRSYDGVTARHRLFHGYPVTHIIAHSQKCKDSFVESGFASEGQVSVHGALRMDNLIKLVNSGKCGAISKDKGRRKRVTLFYFPYSMSLFGKEKISEFEQTLGNKYRYVEVVWQHRMDLFRDLHISIIRLAQKLPEVDFVIKPKQDVLTKRNTSWGEYLRIVNDTGVDLSKLKNYTIEPDANVLDLILNSDVVIALQSSTALESAVAGKPVIFPLFYNYKETKNFNDFLWHKHLDLFDVAESAEEMEALIIKRLENPEIDNKNMDGRRELFKEWFSDLDGVALKNYSETIENVVASAKVKNQHSQSKSIEHGIEKSFYL